MEKKVSELTVSELKTLVRKIVQKELSEFDPDETLLVRPEVKNLLNKSIKERKSGKQKLYSTEEVFFGR